MTAVTGMRVALYYLPDARGPLWQAGASWLGWDSVTGEVRERPEIAGLAAVTTKASRYGFHATIKAPFPLQGDLEAFVAAAAACLATIPAFVLPPMRVVHEDGFVSLRLSENCDALQRMAATCVEQLDGFRRPYAADELAARSRPWHSQRMRHQLAHWGYPHVFEDFVFHLTLTDPVPERDWLEQARHYFSADLLGQRELNQLAVLVEPYPGAPLVVKQFLPLGCAVQT